MARILSNTATTITFDAVSQNLKWTASGLTYYIVNDGDHFWQKVAYATPCELDPNIGSAGGLDPALTRKFTFNPPAWPLIDDLGRTWNQERLEQEYIEKYQPLVDRGVKVHVGEWGVFNKTPHSVALAWMEDSLSLWKKAGWGFALWNLRGSFGVLDSERHDVKYENYKGHKLDRKMLELLKAY